MIYFLQGKDTRRIKIGYTDKPITKRWDQLDVSSEELELLLLIKGTQKEENKIHRRFKHLRHKGEWFDESKELLDFINSFSPDLLEENQKCAKQIRI